ncbi:uncharacterized protein PV09_03111 [Verruconis gallopava]|uniref:beta-glucosidase n=1 Tax=Verruconis gallopava TaxID=253628 RepID=A0A0D2AG24_9PEZI|nr:uncharacterized protein PV09_03111 [Verruconis gallopava]KIW05918.1 hypothetical protein PV09_03111 [Verruconis gallopava]
MHKSNFPLTPPSPYDPFNVEETLIRLTEKEKIDLLTGIDHWHTAGVPRLGVPSIRVSDGPNGVRGTRFFNGQRAACLPCGTALGATWDTELLQRAGDLLGEETKAKGAHVLLGPTVNMQRSPLGGRGFESFSEDPILAGSCAASVVRGIQKTGTAACIKHFVANDQEHERMAVSAIVTDRALREIYLLPFQITIRESAPRALMTAYNKINGTHASERREYIQHILREEWGWEGLVMSDWYGTYSTAEAINAGLDLEMPGPSRWRGQLLSHALLSKKVTRHTLDQRVREVLRFVTQAAKTGIPENAPERARNVPETAELLRKLSADSMVLLKNEHDVLPLDKAKSVAAIGPNTKNPAFCGGGSASLQPYYVVSPFEGMMRKAQDVQYAVGCAAYKLLPLLGPHLRTKDGNPGVTFKAYASPPTEAGSEPVEILNVLDTYIYLSDYSHPRLVQDLWWAEVEGYFTAEETGDFQFGLTVYGTGKLYIDDELVVDNEAKQRSGGSFFNVGTVEEIGIKRVYQGMTYKLKVSFASGVTSKLANPDGVVSFGGGGIRIGGAKILDPEEEIRKAVQLAKSVDQAVLFVGLNSDYEQEGHDRQHMHLPGLTDRLVQEVAAANPRTVVVVQSGTPVSMPWASSVAGIIQAWYGGNETGNAIADVLYGDINPSGKLPLSFPVRIEDNPAYLNFSSERGRVLYGEDIFIGYRWYEATKREPLWSFGWGLSYTSFRFYDLLVLNDRQSSQLVVKVWLENTGKIDGAEVVQVYVSQRSPSVRRPCKELKGFAKKFLKAGEAAMVEIVMDRKYATSFWDEERNMWIEEADTFDVLVGNSSAETPLRGSFSIEKTSWWSGL